MTQNTEDKMKKRTITQKDLEKLVLESTRRLVEENESEIIPGYGDDDYLTGLMDSVSIALADKYGFGTEASYTAAEKAVSQLDDVDRLTGDENDDFGMVLQRCLSNYINESFKRGFVVKESFDNGYQEFAGTVAMVLSRIENTFKKDDIDNVDPEVLKELIISIYDELSSLRQNL